MTGHFETLDVDGSSMPVYLAEGDGGGAGVLVCMHAPGVDAFIQDICHRLADAGFTAAAPDLYHRQDAGDLNPLERMGLLRDTEILRDYEVAGDWLAGRSDPGRQGVIGFCMGGRLSYLWAAHRGGLRAAVVFYGGNILMPWGDAPAPFDRTGEIDCPLLGLFGNDDENPSPADVDRIAAELDRAGKRYEFHRYDGAGHAFLNFMRPSLREEAAADAWNRCADFLRAHT